MLFPIYLMLLMLSLKLLHLLMSEMSDSETDASDVFDDYQCEDNYEDFVVKDDANNTNKNELTVYDHIIFDEI